MPGRGNTAPKGSVSAQCPVLVAAMPVVMLRLQSAAVGKAVAAGHPFLPEARSLVDLHQLAMRLSHGAALRSFDPVDSEAGILVFLCARPCHRRGDGQVIVVTQHLLRRLQAAQVAVDTDLVEQGGRELAEVAQALGLLSHLVLFFLLNCRPLSATWVCR